MTTPLPPMPKTNRQSPNLDALLKRMEPWPASWAGDEDDETIGQHFVQVLLPFMRALHQQGLSAKTLRRHLDNLWLLGSEIIRDVADDPSLRNKPPLQLIQTAVEDGSAPLVGDLSELQQSALDATARKLHRFLVAHDPGSN